MNLFEVVAFAESTAQTANPQEVSPVMSSIVSFMSMILIIVFMYFILIRPQRKKEKELREQIREMKVGDKVVTIGGIVGKVNKIKDNIVTIETGNVGTPSEKSFIKFEIDAIKSIEKKITN